MWRKGFCSPAVSLTVSFYIKKNEGKRVQFFLFCEDIRALLFSRSCGFLAIFRLGRVGGCCNCRSCENVKLDNTWNAKLESIQSLLKKNKQRKKAPPSRPKCAGPAKEEGSAGPRELLPTTGQGAGMWAETERWVRSKTMRTTLKHSVFPSKHKGVVTTKRIWSLRYTEEKQKQNNTQNQFNCWPFWFNPTLKVWQRGIPISRTQYCLF